jgi:hypothetical protein
MKMKCLKLSVVILSLIASLLRTAEQYKAKKVEILVALLHVPRYPTDYFTPVATETRCFLYLQPQLQMCTFGECDAYQACNMR